MISLWGFMGAGKSTIGMHFAENESFQWMDSDDEIERREGMSISSIFEVYGEAYFRRQETALLQSLQKEQGQYAKTILTTGGGMPMQAENRQLLKQLGPTIFLHVSFEEIEKRLSEDHQRPLWDEKNRSKMKRLYEERLPFYEQADFIVHTDLLSIQEITQEIHQYVSRSHS